MRRNTGIENIMTRKQKRFDELECDCDQRTYNAVMTITVLHGILMNVVLCQELPNPTRYLDSNLFFILYLICTAVGAIIALESDKPLVSFAGYNLIVLPTGVFVSAIVDAIGGMHSNIVRNAFLLTLIITLTMSTVAIVNPNWVSGLGKTLAFSLTGAVLAGVVCVVFRIHTNAVSWIFAVIFSAYIAYDVWKSQQYPCTIDNAIDSAIDIYLDIINLFIYILKILGNKKRED